MKKFLLSIAAAVAVVCNVNAQTTVLWSSETAEGVEATWSDPLLTLDAEKTAELIKPGDVITMTVVSVTESGWPQVALFDAAVGWPPLTNVGVGGQTYPYVAKFPVSNDLAAQLSANGVAFKGEGALVTEIARIAGPGYLDPNTVWFGEETLAWGKAISVPASVFENVKVGDKIEVKYDTAKEEHTLQILLGGWSGLNLATYEAGNYDFMNINEETGTITIELTDALEAYDKEGTVYDAFKLLKENGLVMQGPCTVTAVLYIPFDESSAVEAIATEEAEAVYYNLQGLPVANPAAGQIYIVKKGNKASKVIF